MGANVVEKINAMQHRMLTNAASRKRVFQAQTQKRVGPVEPPPPSSTDAEEETPAAEAATS